VRAAEKEMIARSCTRYVEEAFRLRPLLWTRPSVSVLVDGRLLDGERIIRIRPTNRRHRRRVISSIHESNVPVVVHRATQVEVTPEVGDGDDRELESLRGMDRHDPDALGVTGNICLPLTGVDLGLTADPVKQPGSV